MLRADLLAPDHPSQAEDVVLQLKVGISPRRYRPEAKYSKARFFVPIYYGVVVEIKYVDGEPELLNAESNFKVHLCMNMTE